jgi:uncharacterized membrane protein YgcG
MELPCQRVDWSSRTQEETMECRLGRSVAVSVMIMALAVATRTAAIAPEVRDQGMFFTADTIKQANEEIRDLMRKYERDLLVETFVTVPENQKEKVRKMSREEKHEFFRSWANERVQTNVVNGVYILVCADPTYVRLEITARVRSAFDKAAIDKLNEALLKRFEMKQFDEGLLAAIKVVRDRFARMSK